MLFSISRYSQMRTLTQQGVAGSPYTLSIGNPALKGRRLKLKPGMITDLHSGKNITFEQLIAALDRFPFIFVGENHDNPHHHQFQAELIRGLVQRGRPVLVGMEMFSRTKQYPLDLWTLGRLTESEFIELSEWKRQWGFDYRLYKPVFDTVKEFRLRLVGLNLPRAIVSKVGREGWQALSEEERMGVPDLDLSHAEHRQLFEAMMAGHPPGPGLEKMYAAQVLWDTAMADSIIRYLERTPPSAHLAFVVLAGNGHVMYGLGIPLRLMQRTSLPSATIVCLAQDQDSQPLWVSRSLADYVYVAGSSPSPSASG